MAQSGQSRKGENKTEKPNGFFYFYCIERRKGAEDNQVRERKMIPLSYTSPKDVV